MMFTLPWLTLTAQGSDLVGKRSFRPPWVTFGFDIYLSFDVDQTLSLPNPKFMKNTKTGN